MRRAAVVTGTVVVLFASAGCSDPTNPTENEHAKYCVDTGGSIHAYSQFGGKYYRSTYWCEDAGRRITDLWFENTEKGYRDV
jgi:hypothetical protein